MFITAQKNIPIALGVFALGAIALTGSTETVYAMPKASVDVDCIAGDTIADALASGANKINIIGDCVESVVITEDEITLNGKNSGTITGDGSGPAITVAADHIVIEDFGEIDGGLDDGIVVRAAGSALVQNISMITGRDGVVVSEAAHVEVNTVTIDASDDGVFAVLNGSALLVATNSSGNGDDGVVAGAGGAVNINGGNVINGNGGQGIFSSGGHIRFDGANTVQFNPGGDIRCTAFSRVAVFQKIESETGIQIVDARCALISTVGPIFFDPIP